MNPRDYQFCFCCYVRVPDEAKTLLCPECFQALSSKTALPKIYCTTHKRDIDPTKVTI